jgi:hypothetical protein
MRRRLRTSVRRNVSEKQVARTSDQVQEQVDMANPAGRGGFKRGKSIPAVGRASSLVRDPSQHHPLIKTGFAGRRSNALSASIGRCSPAPAFASHQEASMTDLEVMQQRAGAIGLSVVYLHPIFVIRIGNGCLRSYTDPQAALECLNKLEARHAATIPVRG